MLLGINETLSPFLFLCIPNAREKLLSGICDFPSSTISMPGPDGTEADELTSSEVSRLLKTEKV